MKPPVENPVVGFQPLAAITKCELDLLEVIEA